MGWNANSLSARMLHLLHQFVPGLYSVTLFLSTSSNTAYSLSGIGRFDKIYRGYFMVGECGRFFFTSCERRERTSERSERVSSATPRNE